MLPTIPLHSSEFTIFETDLNSPNLLPEQAAEPGTTFADLLGLSSRLLPESQAAPSQWMPDSGKVLPLPGLDLPPVHDLPEAVDRIDPAQELPINFAPMSMQTRNSGPSDTIQSVSTSSNGKPDYSIPQLGITPAPLDSRPPPTMPAIADIAIVPDAAPRRPATTETGMIPATTAVAAAAKEIARPPIRPDVARTSVQPSLRPSPEPAAVTERQAQPVALPTDAKPIPELPRQAPWTASSRGGNETVTKLPESAPRAVGETRQTELPRETRLPVVGLTSTDVSVQPRATTKLESEPAVSQLAPVAAPTKPQAFAANEVATPGMQLTGRIDVPVRDVAWGEQLGQRLQLMASNRLQSAEIRLSPAELGPLRVQVAIDDGAANVSFHAQHTITREAIEQALPRLREMLAENGIALNQADIGEQGAHRGGRETGDKTQGSPRTASDVTTDNDADDGAGSAPPQRQADGLVDTFV